METAAAKNITEPPGGILIWIIVFLELITFSIALVFMAVAGKSEATLFHNSRLLLNTLVGTTNTIILLSSGYFMAQGLKFYKADDKIKSQQNIRITMFLGILFLILKGSEFYFKIQSGIDISTNTFFTFYWLLTSFHFIHIALGLVILFFINKYNVQDTTVITQENMEAGATFWHMCDLIWLLIFPMLYLYF